MQMQIKKRHILLLEVLIAFAIIVLCIFPLIYPHAAMAKSQREFIKKIELDHVVTLLFSQVYQDLQTNRIPWSDIEGKRKFELLPETLKKLNDDRSLPFKGYYAFEPIIQKPKATTSQETTAYLYHVVFKFYPQIASKEKKKKPLEYKYKIFILRDLRTDKEPVNQETEKIPDEK